MSKPEIILSKEDKIAMRISLDKIDQGIFNIINDKAEEYANSKFSKKKDSTAWIKAYKKFFGQHAESLNNQLYSMAIKTFKKRKEE